MHHLKNADALGIQGNYRITRIDFAAELRRGEAPPCIDMEHRHGLCPLGLSHAVEDYEGHNTIVTSLKESLINQATGAAAGLNLLVTRIATGTDASATLAAQTQLGAEFFRDVPTSLQKVTALQLQAFWYFGTTQANAASDLQEWGILAGGATGVAGSGTMLARFLQRFAKNSGTTASGQYTLTVA